jgi:glycosyltransferase involved in cell wall biosynthesis
VIFLFAGKFQIKKDVALLINVFKKTGLKKVHLMLVGNGPLEHELRSLANGRKQIHFMDFQNQQIMPAIYQLCDVFVLPSKGPGETWGLAVNEAMASGKPVLVSDKCGCATDLVTKGKTGFVFKSGNQNDLEEKMKLLAEDKSKCEEMGKNALQKIRNWSFERVVEAIENIVINRC